MKNLLFAFSLLIVFSSCNKIECAEYTDEVIYQHIDNGALYGNGEEGISEENFVITSSSEWTALKNKMDAVNNVSDEFANTPINFDEQFVIASFDKVQSNGGHVLEISNLVFNGASLEASILKTGGSGMSTSVITQPYHIIVLDKCDENPEVIFN